MPVKSKKTTDELRQYDSTLPAGAGFIEIDPWLGTDLGDRDFWARSLVASRQRRNKSAPSAVDLEQAILNLKITDTMKGSSTIELTVWDEGYELTDSGFFDADGDGRVDPMEVNYPEGSDLWWRLTQTGMDDSASGGFKYTMTFMERAALHMMAHHGPTKMSRGKSTRAEFLEFLSSAVKANGGITFHSKELHKKQPIASLTATEIAAKKKQKAQEDKKDAKTRKNAKEAGINRNEKITFTYWDGSTVTLKPGQLENAERVLDEAFNHTEDERPLLALLCACIVEGPLFDNPMGGDRTSVGILQLLDSWGPASKRRDIAWTVAKFLDDGFYGKRDPSAKGAIDVAKKHPDWTVGEIAQETQGSGYPDRYEKVKDGAKQVLAAYGGSSSSTTGGGGGSEYTQQYNFEVGSLENPRENYWDASNRLADEVKWPYFLDGQDLYFDPEPSLMRQKPVAVIERGDPQVISFRSNWDGRHIATEAELVLLCNPFEFKAGEVFKVVGYGAASTGSTCGLPGRWLIEEAERDRFELTTRFTLKQAEDPAPEPRSQTAQHQADEKKSGGRDTGPPGSLREKIVRIARDSMANPPTTHYLAGGIQTAASLRELHPKAGYRSDCSQWVYAVYVKAGAPSPGLTTDQMEAQCKKTSNPKPGDLVLMHGHVELYVGPNGKTIGHGSPPIDEGNFSYFTSRGAYYATYDFLDAQDDNPKGAHTATAPARNGPAVASAD